MKVTYAASNCEFLLLSCIFLLFASCRNQAARPPVAMVIPHDTALHGDTRTDNYFWLRQRDSQDVTDYLEAENAYTATMTKHTEALQEKLFQEMVGRIKETDLEVPEERDQYYYYARSEEGKQYQILCRKKDSLTAPEEILLDQNVLAKDEDYFRLGIVRVSPNHKLLAYSVDGSGAERYTIYVKNLETGELLPDRITNNYYSLEWANDNQTLYYNTLDDAQRPFKVFRHLLGTVPQADELVHFEEDDAYYVSLSKSKDEQVLFLELNSITTSEVWFLNAGTSGRKFKLIQPRRHKIEYSLDHHGGDFFIMTNEDAINFKLMRVPASHPDKEKWTEVIPHRQTTKLSGFELFENHLVVYEREKGLEKIRIMSFADGKTHYVSFEEPAYSIRTSRNPEFSTNILRFKYSSLVTPESVFDYNMDERTREIKKQKEVLGGYDPAQYQTERIFAPARDGAEIPISLVYKKGLSKNGKNPLFLYGYGSYGVTIDPDFSSTRLSLLDRGFVYAIAHVRGGGLLGRPWYEEGKLLKKKNTFTDFIDVTEFLIDQGFTTKGKIAIYGGSAGGLLMGTVLNMRPDLFQVAVAKVPFVDVINTMLDASIPLTVIEYEEWGNPNEKPYYDYMKSYSPYDNVVAQDYPDILITAGLNDPRVQYWEPAKWTAKLRALKTDDNILLLKTFMGAGHSGSSGRYDRFKDIAFDYAFVLDRLQIGV